MEEVLLLAFVVCFAVLSSFHFLTLLQVFLYMFFIAMFMGNGRMM